MISAFALGAVLFVLGFVPLLGGPRYEAALAAGILVPTWTGVWTALVLNREYRQGPRDPKGEPKTGVARAMSSKGWEVALSHSGVVFFVATLHGFRLGFCEPASGYALLALGPCFGAILMSQWAHVGVIGLRWSLGKRFSERALSWLAGLFPFFLALASAAIRFWHFYSSPTVFAYDPFVGYFSGPVYDTVSYEIGRLLSFRVGSFFTLGALVWALSLVGVIPGQGAARFHITLGSGKKAAIRSAFLVVLVGGSSAHSVYSDRLTHTQSAASIQFALGRQLRVGPCKVVFSAGVERRVAENTAQECVGHLRQLENYFQIPMPPDVTVYLFADAKEKHLLMGAATTYIAKPWRREIYLQPASFPHPVLGHELAHVFTGQFGAGPFKVAGRMAGLLADPGRIEGFAVAAAPNEHSDGTLDEWTSAMKQIGLLPRLTQIFQLGFLSTSAARSYTAAGSFVDFVRREYGADVLRSWYGGAGLAPLTGQSWEALESAWHRHLDAVTVPQAVLSISKPRFSRPGVFERRCPHAVDRATQAAGRLCLSQPNRAIAWAKRAVQLDPLRADLEVALVRCAYAAGGRQTALALAAQSLERSGRYSPEAQRTLHEFVGDLHYHAGRHAEAQAEYELELASTFGREAKRQVEFKLWGLQQPEPVRSWVQELMTDVPGAARDASLLLGQWSSGGPSVSVAEYLLARRLTAAGDLEHAGSWWERLDVEKLPLQSLRKEAYRSRLLWACQSSYGGGGISRLRRNFDDYLRQDLSAVEEMEARRVVQRCAPGLR